MLTSGCSNSLRRRQKPGDPSPVLRLRRSFSRIIFFTSSCHVFCLGRNEEFSRCTWDRGIAGLRPAHFLSSLRDLVSGLRSSSQDCVLGYSRSSLRDWVLGWDTVPRTCVLERRCQTGCSPFLFDYAPVSKQKLFSEHPVCQRLSSRLSYHAFPRGH